MSGGICYHSGRERGLWFEIECLERLVASPTISDKEKKFCKGILHAYKKLTEKDYGRSATGVPTLVECQK